MGYQTSNSHKHPVFLRFKRKVMKQFVPASLLLIIILVAGCSKDDDKQPLQTGSIMGQLALADEFGNVFTDHGGMVITIVGKSFDSSDAVGNYRIDNLPSGNFELEYEMDGFGTFKKFGIQVVAGAAATVLNGVDYLGEKSTTVVDSLTVTINQLASTFNIGCKITPAPTVSTPRAFRLFFGKNTSVNNLEYQYAPSNTWIATTSTGAILNYDPIELYSNGFTSGETVYVIAYGDSKYSNSYTDPSTNKKVYPNVNLPGASDVVDFILP